MNPHAGLTCFFAALLLTASPPVAAPLAAKERAAPVVIPFNPPLNQPVRYRISMTERGEGGDKELSSLEEMRFERVEGGYRVSVKSSDVKIVDKDLPEALQKQMRELAKIPYVLRISEDAKILELENSDVLWAQIIDLSERALGSSAQEKNESDEERAQRNAFMANYMQSFRDMKKEERLALLTQSLQTVFQFGQTEWKKPVTTDVETATPFGTITQKIHIGLPTISGGTAIFNSRGVVPKKGMAKFLKQLTANLTEEIPGAEKLNLKKYGHDNERSGNLASVHAGRFACPVREPPHLPANRRASADELYRNYDSRSVEVIFYHSTNPRFA